MVAEARGVACRAALVVSVVRFGALRRRLLLVGRVLRTFGPTVLCRATWGAVHFTQGELTLAVLLAASRGLPLSRLIVARAIPIANRAVTTVAFRRSVGRPAVVVIAIVENAMMTAAISLLINVTVSIVAKGKLASGALAAPTVSDVADASTKLL